MPTDRSLGDGVYFDRDAYPGIVRRSVAMMIDAVLLSLIGLANWLLLLLVFYALEFTTTPDTLHLGMFLTFIWLYMTVVKRSRFGTVGYWLCGIRIIDLRGNRPSLTRMTFRLVMWTFGPFNFIVDLIWLGADSEQQTLRDCYCGTYVVRSTAQPQGTAALHLTRYFATGLAPSYPRVVRPRKFA
ncbi:RDD family protein [Rhodopirellula baltica]|uniref:RDD family protein n=1 Tax=Rhodopirellula baltica TaxID=265606 RepID=UPI0005663BBF|nr:RDD family protein [Rhodopirellula baltica]